MPVMFPGKFAAHRTGWLFTAFGDCLTIVLIFTLIAPGAMLIYLADHGSALLGLGGLAAWMLILWCILVQLHNAGLVRIGISATLAVVTYGILALALANA